MKRFFTKRMLDVLGSGVGLLATAPVMGGAALAVRLTMGSPVLFRQRGPALRGEPFELVKFRTMRTPTAGEDMLRTDGQRITALGKLMRATSIDELPTLVNVLKGEMSLVGPRPL